MGLLFGHSLARACYASVSPNPCASTFVAYLCGSVSIIRVCPRLNENVLVSVFACAQANLAFRSRLSLVVPVTVSPSFWENVVTSR